MSKKSKINALQNIVLHVYKGYAQVEGVYPVSLAEGDNTFQIEGLPTQYRQRSLRFEPFAGPGEVTLGPRRYRAANLDRNTLRTMFLNKKVTVRYASAETEKTLCGKFLGIEDSTVFLKTRKGVREVPNFIAFDYDQLPEGVSNTPALEVTVTAAKKGNYEANLVFKADGFDWDIVYTLVYDEKKGVADWESEVHITNQSGASYANAQISVVAGDTNQPVAYAARARGMRAAAFADVADEGGLESVQSKRVNSMTAAESLGQVKVYPVPDTGDVEQGDEQTFDFFYAKDVPVKRELRVRAQNRWHASPRVEQQVRTILQFQTGTATPLSLALPAGQVNVLAVGSGNKKVEAGGAYKQDNALGEELKLETGSDFDVKAVRLVKKEERADSYKALPLPEVEDEQQFNVNEGGMEVMQPAVTAKRVRKPVAKPVAKPYEKTVVVTKECVFEVFNGKEMDVEVVFEEATDSQLRLKGKHGFSETTNGRQEQTVRVGAGKRVQVPYTLVYTSVETVNLTDDQARACKAL